MKVSFIITYYNQEQFVAQSMESILAIKKSYDWEILVGDDGSSDGTAEVVRNYVNQYPDNIFLYVMPRDPDKKYNPVKRLGENKINLFAHATGDVFCNLDGDDYYCDTGFVEEALDILEKQPEVSVVAFGFKYVIDGVDGGEVLLPVDGPINTYTYLQNCYTPIGTCVIRNVKDENKFNRIKELGFFDDNSITINNLDYGTMYAVRRAIYAYRQNSVSIMNSLDTIGKHLHNVQGYDIDVKLIDPSYEKSLQLRYSYSIIKMYLWRKELEQLYGKEKLAQYLAECKDIGDSLAYKIAKYDEIDSNEKKLVNSVVLFTMKNRVKFTIKEIIKKFFKLR